MHDATQELKTRASILHAHIESGDPAALARLKKLPQFRKAPPEDLRAAQFNIQHQDCLNVIAAEWGFPSWPEAKRVLSGEAIAPANFGNLLCPPHCATHLNHWTVDYGQAAALRAERGAYLLAYRTQYFLVERFFIKDLGLDPDDPDWQEMGFDWAKPSNLEARTRLYSKLVAKLPREAATPAKGEG